MSDIAFELEPAKKIRPLEQLERAPVFSEGEWSRRAQSAELHALDKRTGDTSGKAAPAADPVLQLKGDGRSGSSLAGALAGSGDRLPDGLRSRMERSFGQDFGSVRVREDTKAAQIGARAFTAGEQVVFAPGQYRTGSAVSQRLLAHELAHVVQQREGRAQAKAGSGGVVHDQGLEREADNMGDRAVAGAPGPEMMSSTSHTAASSPAIQMEPELSAYKIRRAISYNKRKLSSEMVAAIANFLGTPAQIDDAFVIKVAAYQDTNGLGFDGMVGGGTLRSLIKVTDLPLVPSHKVDAAAAYNEKRLALPLVYRVESLLGMPKNGVIAERFVQKVAGFQLQKRLGVDGWLGPGTERYMKQAGLVTEDIKGTYYQYGRMFMDALLDITIGQGFDENDWDLVNDTTLRSGIPGRGFSENQAKVEELIKKSGKTPTMVGDFHYYYKEHIADYGGKEVNAVIRYAPSRKKSGAERKAAFVQGLKQSDAAIYCGHARYGTGPDFDRNFLVELKRTDGVWESFPDYGDLEEDLHDKDFVKKFGNYSGSPLTIIKAMNRDGIFRLNATSVGNVVINKTSPYATETFGSYLITLAVNHPDAQQPIDPALINDENYRLWIFSGCSTKMYIQGIRKHQSGSKGFTPRNLDMLVTNQSTWSHLSAEHVFAYLDGLLGMQSVEAIMKRFDEVQTEKIVDGKKKVYTDKGALRSDGLTDNPSVR